MSFLAALHLLTTIPVRRHLSADDFGRSMVHFPTVGLALGAILVAEELVLGTWVPVAARSQMLVISLVILTGALHLDGVGDTFDGMAGHRTVERRLEIMRDSHVGAFGVVAIACVLLGKAAALAAVPGPARIPALLLVPVLARWAPVYAVHAHPYARSEGFGKLLKDHAKPSTLIAATLLAAGAGIAIAGANGLVAFAILALATAFLARRFAAKLGGLTGDCYGAVVELTELLGFLAFALLLHANLPAWRWF